MCDLDDHYNYNMSCGGNLGGYCDVGNTSVCICQPGFSHDLTLLRQRDCSLHYVIMPIFCTWYMIGSLVVLDFSVREALKSKGIARQILACVALHCLFNTAFCIYMTFNKYQADGVSLTFGFVKFAFAFTLVSLVVHSLAAPLFQLAGVPERYLTLGLKTLNITFRVFGFILTVTAITLYNDFNNPANDRAWTTIIATIFFLYGLETTIIQISIQFFGRRMITQIEDVIRKTPDNPNNESTRQHIEKVRNLLNNMLKTTSGFGLAWLIPPMVVFATGYFPAHNLVLSFTFFVAPFFAGFIAVYAKREIRKDAEAGNNLTSDQGESHQVGSEKRSMAVVSDGFHEEEMNNHPPSSHPQAPPSAPPSIHPSDYPEVKV